MSDSGQWRESGVLSKEEVKIHVIPIRLIGTCGGRHLSLFNTAERERGNDKST